MSESMWTSEQREAVAQAKDTMTGRQVAAAAAAGELLLEGREVAPFEITDKQVRDVASQVRKKRPPGDRAARLAWLDERALRHAEREMRILEKAKPGQGDMQRFQRLTVAIGRLHENQRLAKASSSTSPTAPQRASVAPAVSDGGALLQAMRGEQAPDSPAAANGSRWTELSARRVA